MKNWAGEGGTGETRTEEARSASPQKKPRREIIPREASCVLYNKQTSYSSVVTNIS